MLTSKRYDFLLKAKNQVANNLFAYSDNYLMTKPKKGYEESYRETLAELEMLEEWINEYVEKL